MLDNKSLTRRLRLQRLQDFVLCNWYHPDAPHTQSAKLLVPVTMGTFAAARSEDGIR